jgi:hypothetical protein
MYISNGSSFQNKPFSSLIYTKLNRKAIHFNEMCLRVNNEDGIMAKNNSGLIPLSAFFTTHHPTSKDSHLQWMHTFFDATKSNEFKPKNSLYIICDNSMGLVESILEKFNFKSFNKYANGCLKASIKNVNDINYNLVNLIISTCEIETLNRELAQVFNDETTKADVFVHTCTNQFMNEINNLCQLYFSKNIPFAMGLFSCLVNSQSLFEFEQTLAAFICILYSKYSSSLVDKALEYFRSRQIYYESMNENETRKQQKSKVKHVENECFIYKSETFKKSNKFNADRHIDDQSVGLRALKRTRSVVPLTDLEQQEEIRLDELNSDSLCFKMCEKLFEKVKLVCDKRDKELDEEKVESITELNIYIGHELLNYFLRQFAACIPLWANRNIFLLSNQSVIYHISCIYGNLPFSRKGMSPPHIK